MRHDFLHRLLFLHDHHLLSTATGSATTASTASTTTPISSCATTASTASTASSVFHHHIMQAAQWRDERLREALPLPLCRPGGAFDRSADGPRWLGRARTLLREHLGTRPASERLQRALDAALRKRQALIEGKRRQLIQFMGMAPRPSAEDGGIL